MRFCLVQYSNNAVEMDEASLSGVYGSGVVFRGPLSAPLVWMNQGFFGYEKFNYTFIVKKSFGRYNESSGWYDKESCPGAMQMNETDTAYAWTKMPVLAHGLRPTMPVIQDSLQMLSKYNITKSLKIPDVFNSFRSAFDKYIWIVLALFLVAFVILVKAHVKLHNRHVKERKMNFVTRIWGKFKPSSAPANLRVHKPLGNGSRVKVPKVNKWKQLRIHPTTEPSREKLTFLKDTAIYDVLTHLFQVESIDYGNISMRIVSLFMTLLSFWIINYFSNLMSTDMVLEDDPAVIRSYKDLLQHSKLRMVFTAFQDDYKQFEYAPPGSVKRQLWEKSLESVNGTREKLFLKIDSASGLFSSAVDSITATVNVDEKNRIELVAVLSSVIATTARATACHSKATFAYRNAKTDAIFAKLFKPVESVYSWLAQDPDEREQWATPLFRQDFRTPLARRMVKRLTNLFEVGTIQYHLEKSLRKSALTEHKIETPDEEDAYRQCMSDNIKDNMKKSEHIALKPEQFKYLIYSCAVILFLASLVLCYEAWYSH